MFPSRRVTGWYLFLRSWWHYFAPHADQTVQQRGLSKETQTAHNRQGKRRDTATITRVAADDVWVESREEGVWSSQRSLCRANSWWCGQRVSRQDCYCCSPNKASIGRMCVHDPEESRVTAVQRGHPPTSMLFKSSQGHSQQRWSNKSGTCCHCNHQRVFVFLYT